MSLFFKDIFPYRIISNEIKENEIQSGTEEHRIVPLENLDGLEVLSKGWDNILETENDAYLKVGKSAYILKMKIQEKKVSSSYVNEILKEQIKEILQSGGMRPSKKEQKSMKENIVAVELPKTRPTSSYIDGYLDFKNNILVVNSSSNGKTDTFLEQIRETFSDLQFEPINPKEDVSSILGDWIREAKAEDPFDLGDNSTLKDPLGDSKITASKQDLTAEEIKNHLSKGKIVEKIDLSWSKRISFSLNEKFKISKVKFLDIVKEQIKEDLGQSDDERAEAQASMYIMVEDFAELLLDLQKIF